MTAPWRERITLVGCILLAVGMLGFLITSLLHEKIVVRKLEKRVSLVVLVQRPPIPVPPPPPPEFSPPPKVTRPPVAKVPPMAAPRIQQAVWRPQAQSAPKSPAPPQKNVLTMNAPTALDSFEIAQGPGAGHLIGGGGSGGRGIRIGGGGGGGGGECGQLQAMGYLEKANYEVVRRFQDDPTINRHEFFAKVRLWFSSTGSVTQTEFASSTGDSRLDEAVATLLRTIDMKETVPECIQPITVVLASPWNARSGKADDAQPDSKVQSSRTLNWQHFRPH